MKHALIFRGGWDGHEPVQTSELIAKELEKRGMEVEISDSQDALLQNGLEHKYDVIIPVWTMGTLLPEAGRALRAAVLAGVGLGGWHGGMCDAFRNDTDYQFMTGGQWVAHPGNAIDYRVRITAEDPIVDGIGDFDLHSEQYYMHVDPGNEVLAVTPLQRSGLSLDRRHGHAGRLETKVRQRQDLLLLAGTLCRGVYPLSADSGNHRPGHSLGGELIFRSLRSPENRTAGYAAGRIRPCLRFRRIRNYLFSGVRELV